MLPAPLSRPAIMCGIRVCGAQVSYDAGAGKLEVTLSQKCGPSPGQPTKEPYHIPVRVGVLGKASGKELVGDTVLELRKATESGATDASATIRSKLFIIIAREGTSLAPPAFPSQESRAGVRASRGSA